MTELPALAKTPEPAKTYSQKACDICPEDRIQIGINFSEIPMWRQLLAIPFIYVPIIVTMPFTVLGLLFTRWHFLILGAKNLKTYKHFLPKKSSFRYPTRESYITIEKSSFWNLHVRIKAFWYFNCTWYCPYSVALFEYMTYLVKAVENWWCPFFHEKKSDYADAPMDRSYWHTYMGWKKKLHKDDEDCAIWNDKSSKIKKEPS